jgi:cobalamin biosynthesis protein CobT
MHPFLANGKAAIELNNKFKDIKAGQKCTFTEPQCAGDKLANCLAGKVVTQSCGTGTVCRALPLVNKAGTSVTCDTAADADARITATGASSDASTSTSDSQDTKKSDDKESSEVDASSQEDKSEDNTDKENIDLSGSEDKEVSEDDSEETAAEDTSAEETTEETTEEDSTSTEAKAEVSATPAAPAGAAKPFTLCEYIQYVFDIRR